MVSPKDFYDLLIGAGIQRFVGVPDSLLQSLCAHIQQKSKKNNYIVAANEGNAVAIAAGTYIGSGRLAAVFLQNSGLGNAVNPINSLI
jgi:phosphonopyruvate decarboxylase